jgi:PAS domain S-box-containing protein
VPSSEQETGNLHALRRRVQRVMQRLNIAADDLPQDLPTTLTGNLRDPMHLQQPEVESQEEMLQRTQAALDSERARFIDLLAYTSKLYDQAPVGYLTLTRDGTIVEANRTAVELLEVARASLLQQPVTHFILTDDQEAFRAFCEQLHAGQATARCELRLVRTDGTSFFVQMDATVTPTIIGESDLAASNERTNESIYQQPTAGSYLRITISDISARKELEADQRQTRADLEAALHDLRQQQEQLIRQERLAVVGQLSAGIAHDFNNIMASITLYAQLALRADEVPPALQKRLEAIVSQSDRAAHLVQQMLDFSRRTDMVREATALCRYLQQVVTMLQQSLPDTIQVTLDLTTVQANVDDIVDLDMGRMHQILLNLALNARDAMPDGGHLNIQLTRVNVDGDPPLLTTGKLRPGAWLRIAVSDGGTGIAPEALPHLFEPFFTTKGIGQGSGLGLAQALGLVKQHDGEIDVSSVNGQGATFTVYLPASTARPVLPLRGAPKEVPRGNGEVVLVVEDSDFLRMAIVSALTQLGYQSRTASNGQEGFDLVLKEGDGVALILTDLSMPIMGGKELIRAVRGQGYQQPILVLTGQPLSPGEVEHLQSYGRVSRLQKPAAIDRLAFALHHALTQPVT